MPSFRIKKLKYLTWIMNILAVPPLERNTLFTKLVIWSFYFEISGRISIKFKNSAEVSQVGIVVGTLNTTVEVLYNILITLTAILFSNSSKEELLDEIEELDAIISKHDESFAHKQRIIFKDAILLHTFDTVLLVNDIMLFLLTEDKTYLIYYYFDEYYRYRISLSVLYMYCFIKDIV
ncbi:hypothetical protein QE152_g23284 [Popillia japonica]|uniref:Uncharacterized protein n=1 Tax=Popillia japonica TaxID=7064 RepID=A0AAW1KHY5_POPJA